MKFHLLTAFTVAFTCATAAAARGDDGDEPPEATAAQSTAKNSWEHSPYRVGLVGDIPPHPWWPTAADRQEARAKLLGQIQAGFSGLCQCEWLPVASTRNMAFATRRNLPPLTRTDLTGNSSRFDKVLCLSIDTRETPVRFTAREFDVTTEIGGAAVTGTADSGEELLSALTDAALAAFTPVARIEKLEKDEATLTVRGGALVDGDAPLVRSGDVLLPVVTRPAQNADSPGESMALEWTWLTAIEAEGARVRCRYESALDRPLELTADGQTEFLAIVARPSFPATRLTLSTADKSTVPLAGVSVFANGTALQEGGEPANFILPAERGVVWIEARREAVVLARLPLLPGHRESCQIPCADSSPQQLADALAVTMENELALLVARRAVLLARANAALAAKDRTGVSRILEELRALPDAAALEKTLTAQAGSNDNAKPVSHVVRSKRLEAVLALARQHLSAEPIDNLAAQIDQPASDATNPVQTP